MPLPPNFDSPLHLPFNSASLKGRFSPATPDDDPGGEGFFVLLSGQELLVEWDGDRPKLPLGGPDPKSIFIGFWDGKPCRALLSKAPPSPGCTAESLLATDPRLSIEILSLAGIAAQALHWEKNSRRCGRCGCENEMIPGERGKKCGGCGYAHYPHIHPCVIVLVRRPGEVLLTRKAEWPEGRYSLVAGFLDIGECLEEAVAREVREETGVEIGDIRYIGSQNWPFPSQLMAGFTAEYVSGEIRIEETELEDARWFPTHALPTLPPRRSIARYILDHHLQSGG
jgi:NAD+ diphosphatase